MKVILFIILFLYNLSAYSCTWFIFKNDQNKAFVGRTMEWPGELGAEITQVPRDHFNNKYGFVGISHHGLFSDGVNEKGLAISALWLHSSSFAKENGSNFNVSELTKYILGNFENINQAQEMILKNEFFTTKTQATGDIELKLHFAISQPDRKSIVIEFTNGIAKIYDNEVGVMTNDPTYDKHLELWAQYNPKNFSEETFEKFDYSPEGRFNRMAAFNATQSKVPTSLDGINRAWSMINTVDIPKGILYWRWVSNSPQFTSYSIVADLNDLNYYFRTYDNYDIRKVDLKNIDFGKIQYKSDTIFGNTEYKDYSFKDNENK